MILNTILLFVVVFFKCLYYIYVHVDLFVSIYSVLWVMKDFESFSASILQEKQCSTAGCVACVS